MGARAVCVCVVLALLVAAPAQATKLYPHHRPLQQYSLPQLAAWQASAAAHYRTVWRGWWHSHRSLANARHRMPRCAATGVRTPAWVCWYASAARWQQAALARTQARLAAVRAAAARAAAAAWPAHHALWQCISRFEGSPTSVNPNGHYGMLQMHAGWGYGTSYHASDDPAQVQEWAAERAYAASRYSSGFLYGQWFNYDGAAGACLRFA
jgi:hypothetical protein